MAELKKRKPAKKVTNAEREYIRDLRRRSALKMVENGSAKILSPKEYPAPLQRFIKRDRNALYVKLTAATRRKLEARSRKAGLTADELARRRIETSLRRHTG